MKLPFLTVSLSTITTSSDHHRHPSIPSSPWHWVPCGNLETLSFRATPEEASTFNTPPPSATVIDMANEAPAPCLAISSPESSISFSGSDESGSDEIETVIRGLRSDRLFFEPGESNSILDEASKLGTTTACAGCSNTPCTCHNSIITTCPSCSSDPAPFNECTVFLSMESNDPFMDFRTSMEEMIQAHGLKDWECLEELLASYLKVNGKSNHGYIIDAFVDLLVTTLSSSPASYSPCSMSSPVRQPAVASVSGRLMETTTTATATTSSSSSSSSSFSCTSPSSPLSMPSSSLTTPCLSSLDQVDEDDDDENGEENSHLPPPTQLMCNV